jgi:hypothetical protein
MKTSNLTLVAYGGGVGNIARKTKGIPQSQAIEAHRVVRCRGSNVFYTVVSPIMVKLLALDSDSNTECTVSLSG